MFEDSTNDRKTACIVLLGLLIVLGIGCSRGGLEGAIPITGKVFYQGTPITSGEIRYMPVSPAGRVAIGKIESDGTFALTSLKSGDGALPGDYQVVVLVFEQQFNEMEDRVKAREAMGRDLSSRKTPPIPERYYAPETSGLTDTVDRDHPGYIEFELVD